MSGQRPMSPRARQSGLDALGGVVKLDQRAPSPVAVEKGIGALVAGLNARHPGRRWHVASPPHGLEGTGTVGTGHVDHPRVVGPDDKRTVGNGGATAPATDEDVANHSTDKVA